MSVLGDRIYSARIAANMRQEDLARRIGYSRTSVVNMEAGRHETSLATIAKIAKVLKVHPAWLCGWRARK